MSSLNEIVVVTPTSAHQRQVVDEWAPYHAIQELTDSSWTYRFFVWEAILAYPGYTCMAATTPDGSCEGLLAISVKDDVLKVEFLATAPWNFGPGNGIAGIGSGLLALAVTVARDNNCKSLILSSTPESETFYEHLNLTRTGAVDSEGLSLFELRSAGFEEFLAKRSPLATRLGEEGSNVGRA